MQCISGFYTLADGQRHQRRPPLVQSNLTSLWIVQSKLKDYKVSDVRYLACCYRPFKRVQQNPDNYTKNADNIAR